MSLIGIPIGLILGYVVGSKLLPFVLALSYYSGSEVIVSANPLIFIGPALFAVITVWISTRKPGRIAAIVSPVEAVRYTDQDSVNRKKEKQSTDGGKLLRMALSNLGRSKNCTAFSNLSLIFVLRLYKT